MDFAAKIIKANGIVHIIHGIIIGILFAIFLCSVAQYMNFFGGIILTLLIVAIAFLYIYIGYELHAMRPVNKVRALLITSIALSGLEVAIGIMKGEVSGLFFIAELILSIISLTEINDYKKHISSTKKNIKETTRIQPAKDEEPDNGYYDDGL